MTDSRGRTLRAAQRGDADAVEDLVRSCWPKAYRTAYAITGDPAGAEDVAQEGILAAVRSLERFDRSRPFEPWLYRIVANRAVDWSRARTRRAEVMLSDALEPSEPARVQAGISDELMAALLSLDPDDRAIIVLRHLLGFSSTEIAAMLESSPGTVRSTLHRALARLRGQLRDSAFPEPRLMGGVADD